MFKEFKEFAMRGNVVDMAVGIVSLQLALAEPVNAVCPQRVHQYSLQFLLAETGIASRAEQTLGGGEQGTDPVAVDAATLQYQADGLYVDVDKGMLVIELLGDSIIQAAVVFATPAIEAKVEQTGLPAVLYGDGAMVTGPTVIGAGDTKK